MLLALEIIHKTIIKVWKLYACEGYSTKSPSKSQMKVTATQVMKNGWWFV